MTSDGESLADVGEFAVIDRLVRGRRQPSVTVLGPGDDAAVVRAPDGRTVVSTDMLIEGRHFRRDWSTPHHLGRKAIAVNAADVEAMGATPTAFVVAFGAPETTAVDDVTALFDGMWAEAALCGAGIVGGDLVCAPHWVVSVTALGDLGGRAPVTLSGAVPGDVLAVRGDLGWSAAGLTLWQNGFDGFEEFRERHLAPRIPYGAGRAAADGGATAMTDVSDGLFADLHHVADGSGVGIDVSSDALAAPLATLRPAAAASSVDPWSWLLGGGEDHALVATFGGAPPEGWHVIGRVLDGSARVLLDGASWHGDPGWRSY